MARDLASDDPPLVEPAWDEIRSALEDIARLSLLAMPCEDFYAALIARVAHTAGALGGAIWLRNADGEWRAEASCLVASVEFRALWPPPANLARILTVVSLADAGVAIAPAQALPSDERVVNAGEHSLVLAPLGEGAGSARVVAIADPSHVSAATLESHTQFLTAIAELAADFHRRGQWRDLAAREGAWRGLEQFVEQIHRSLDLKATAYAIANEARRLLDCDRVSIATRALTGKCRLLAVSGVESFERRSASVRAIERVGELATQIGASLRVPTARGALPPAVERALDAWLDETHAREAAVLPLRRHRLDAPAPGSGQPLRAGRREPVDDQIGVLFIEQFRTASVDDSSEQRLAVMARHAALALGNAIEHESLPLFPLEKALRGFGWLTRARQWPKAAVAAGALALIALALCLIPADFTVEARGELQPHARRQIFAPESGIVSSTPVVAGQSVRAGETLVTLRKPELDFELSRVLGEIQTNRKRLAAVQAARLATDRGKTDTPEHLNELTAEEEEIKATLAGLGAQEAVLRARQAALVVRSPIAGQTLAWKLEQLLEARPVERGKILLEVGDLDGPWELELRLPDHYAGYVLEARRQLRPDLEVEYLLATDPAITFRGRVENVSLSATADDLYGPHVRLLAQLEGSAPRERRPGATVIAKIHCGRRAIGFVWFHDLISAIRTHVLF